MTDSLPPPLPVDPASRTKGRNCWVTGCGGCLILLGLLVVAGMIFAKLLFVEPFKPIVLTESEIESARAKMQRLQLWDESGQTPGEQFFDKEGLRFSEKEVNYWLGLQDAEMARMLRLDFEPGQLSAELRLGEREGRHMRWIGTVSIQKEAEGLDIRLLDVKMGRFPVPSTFISGYLDINLINELFPDPVSREKFESSIERIEILKDQILIIPVTP